MKNYLIFMISLMIFTNSVLAKTKRHIINLELDEQQVTLINQTTRTGERILIISDKKCSYNDTCYQGKKIEGMIRVYQQDDKKRYTQFYTLKNRRLEWTMMLMQDWQNYGRVDVFVDRISNNHATAWSAYLPYNCNNKGEYDVPHFDLTEVEELLNTSIYPMNAVLESDFDMKEAFEGLAVAISVEEAMDYQVDVHLPSTTLASMATGVTVYALDKGIANTIYGYVENQNTFKAMRRFTKMRGNHETYTQRKALRKAQVASELGFDFMSAAMFNIENSKSECYMIQQKIVHSLL